MINCPICGRMTNDVFINLEDDSRKVEVCSTCFYAGIPDPAPSTLPNKEKQQKTIERREAIAAKAENIMQEYGKLKGAK